MLSLHTERDRIPRYRNPPLVVFSRWGIHRSPHLSRYAAVNNGNTDPSSAYEWLSPISVIHTAVCSLNQRGGVDRLSMQPAEEQTKASITDALLVTASWNRTLRGLTWGKSTCRCIISGLWCSGGNYRKRHNELFSCGIIDPDLYHVIFEEERALRCNDKQHTVLLNLKKAYWNQIKRWNRAWVSGKCFQHHSHEILSCID